MNKGFVTSALLYGILSVYIVLVVGTVAIIGNRKIGTDKIKQSALDDVQDLETAATCFTTENKGVNGLVLKKYNCTEKTVFIPKKIGDVTVTEIGAEAFKNKGIETVTIKSNIEGIYYNAFTGNSNVLFIIKGNTPAIIKPDGVSYDTNTRWGATNSSIRKD